MKKGILYINQFFAGIGGEEKADFPPELREGVVGPGLMFAKNLKDIEITHTIVCGDNFMCSNTDEALKIIFDLIKDLEVDFLFAGPAFQAGRYGVACGTIGKAIKEKYNIPIFSSMHVENPGVQLFKKEFIIFKGNRSAVSMKKDIQTITDYVNKMTSNEKLYSAEEENYFGQGIRYQVLGSETGASRAVKMLLQKLSNEEFITQLPIPELETVPIAAPIKDLKTAKIAIITTGGVVPSDNPDRIQSASATRWGMYDISNSESLEPIIYKTIHAGFDPAAVDKNPDICVPLDALRAYEKESKIGSVDDYFYTTVGTGTTEAEAKRMAEEILVHLTKNKVDGVIMTST